jgi:hypothetical protein
LVAGNENIEAILFRHAQQVAVFEFTPSRVGGGDDFMAAERTEAGS